MCFAFAEQSLWPISKLNKAGFFDVLVIGTAEILATGVSGHILRVTLDPQSQGGLQIPSASSHL